MILKEFYIPYYIEYLFDFFGKYKIKTNQKYSPEVKAKVLDTILTLLNQKILLAGNWEDGKNFNRWNLSNKDVVKKINDLWHEDASYPEFYEIVYFNYEKWYIDLLEKLGLKRNSNWESFLDEKIGDLDKWIEENKPKTD